nr:MAG TPA: hypothetical protein [Caudoviricetes sp.]
MLPTQMSRTWNKEQVVSKMSANKYTYADINNAIKLLSEMRDNCIKKDDDKYDDPKRAEKYDALSLALYAINIIPLL